MRRSIVGSGLLIGLLVGLALPGAAAAFPLSTCTLAAQSSDASGGSLDSASGGADDATQTDPFLVDWDGTVAWRGTTGGLEMKNNAYHVEVFGLPTPLRGGNANDGDDRDGSGTVGVAENAPFRFTGLYFVSGAITGSGGSCEGSGWVKLAGNPVGTIPFVVALGLLVAGLALVGWGLGGHAIAAIVGGLLAGAGAAVMLVIFSVLPLGSMTPVAVTLVGLAIGIVVAVLGRRSRGGTPAPATA